MNYNKYIKSKKTHYISNSGKDEHNRYKAGAAGDQTGHEWELIKWYNRPWTVVLRYPDQKIALRFAEMAIEAALNDYIGYDQGQRTTYWQQLKLAKYSPIAIKVGCEEDCTAGVSSNVKGAGAQFNNDKLFKLPICTSRNMKAKFIEAGFKALTAKKYLIGPEYLLPGDVLLYENHHAAMNVTIGSKVLDQWHPEDASKVEIPLKAEHLTFTGNCHVRKGPDKSCESMGVVKKGETLIFAGLVNEENNWRMVEFNGDTGWVSPKYSKFVEG